MRSSENYGGFACSLKMWKLSIGMNLWIGDPGGEIEIPLGENNGYTVD